MNSFGTLGGPFFVNLLGVLILLFCAAYVVYRLQLRMRTPQLATVDGAIDTREEIRTILRMALRQKVRLRVRLNARRRSFISLFVDMGSDTITIDSLFPDEGNQLVESADFLTLEFMLRETGTERLYIPHFFIASFICFDVVKQLPALRLTMPALIKRVQRRQYLRIDPPVNKPISVCFHIDGQDVQEKIANISGGGIGFFSNMAGELWRGRTLPEVSVALGDTTIIRTAVTVRMIERIDQPVLIDSSPRHYFCGAEFSGIDERQRDQVIQYVIEREREELRRASRQYDD